MSRSSRLLLLLLVLVLGLPLWLRDPEGWWSLLWAWRLLLEGLFSWVEIFSHSGVKMVGIERGVLLFCFVMRP